MFGKGFELFRISDLPIRIDPSWILVAVLMTWSLSTSVFPVMRPGLAPLVYFGMGLVGAMGLFASVVAHELAHALTARRYGIPMRGITLFLFGGVAEMAAEPPSPRAELVVAAAGPLASFGISLAGLGLALLGGLVGLPAPAAAVIAYLASINAVLAVFNVVPAFPLDGGRILRSALWSWKGDLRWATRISSRVGGAFGLALIGAGLLQVVWTRNFLGGAWWLLLGLFIRHAARAAYDQLLVRLAFEGEPVSRFMHINPVAVPRSLSVADLVRSYIYRYQFKMYPVVDDAGLLLGCVTTRRVRELPRDEWDRQTVGAIAERCGPDNTVDVDSDAMRAFVQMSRTGTSRLMVVDDDHLLGILSSRDLMRFLSLKQELEEPA